MRDEVGDSFWLSQACEEFGPAELIDAARAEEAAHKIPQLPTEMPEDWGERINVFTDFLVQMSPANSARLTLEAAVANRICSGEIEAYGFQVRPNPGAHPEIIPSHLFRQHSKIDWIHSRIKSSGWEFEAVVVRRAPVGSAKLVSKSPPSTLKQGRPSKVDEIDRVIEDICAGGRDLNAITRKEACRLIFERAKLLNLNTNIGYSDPVLKRALNRRFGPRS